MTDCLDNLALARLSEPAILANPYPFYARLRTTAPVYWDASWDTWVLSRYSDVVAALRDTRLSAAQFTEDVAWLPVDDRPLAQTVIRSHLQQVLFVDPPAHTRLRKLMSVALTPRVIAGMRARIQSLVDTLLDTRAGDARLDIIADLA